MADKQRAVEFDFLRGLAMVFMLFIHFSWDVRFEFGKHSFGYLTSDGYDIFFHPLVLVLFVGVSGICCTFSRNNIKRGIRLGAVALAFTVVTYIIQKVSDIESLIIFNVLHLLTVGIFVYALIEIIERRLKIKPELTNMIMALTGVYIMLIGQYIHRLDHCTDLKIFLPVGFAIEGTPTMADYLPIFPWLGLFFVGAAIGRSSYSDRQTKLPKMPDAIRKIASPIEFIGRHSLMVYIVHQPIIYGVLALYFKVTGG